MILIMSDETDHSTQYVINWMIYLGIPYFRINETSSILVDYFSVKNGKFSFKLSITSPYLATPFSICANDIKGYWYRRGSFELEKIKIQKTKSMELGMIKEKFNKYLDEENKKVVDFFHEYLTTIPHLGCFLDNFTINKIYEIAQILPSETVSDIGLLSGIGGQILTCSELFLHNQISQDRLSHLHHLLEDNLHEKDKKTCEHPRP